MSAVRLDRAVKRIRVCDLEHGGPGNAAEVYGHHGRSRTCIRLHGTNTWLFDPKWEKS